MSNTRCDYCGNPIIITENQDKNFDKLYLTILEIGQSKVETGVTYNSLVDELQKHGYNIRSGCTELAVKHWFYSAFFHKATEDCPINSLFDLDQHLDCDFILKGETSLKLLEHQNIQKTILLANRTIIVAIIAGLIALLGVYFTYKTVPKNEERQTNIAPQIIQQAKPIWQK